MIQPKDRNGELIEDGDTFKAWVLGEEPIKGKRVGDQLHWEDGVVNDIDEFWNEDFDQGLFDKIETDED